LRKRDCAGWTLFPTRHAAEFRERFTVLSPAIGWPTREEIEEAEFDRGAAAAALVEAIEGRGSGDTLVSAAALLMGAASVEGQVRQAQRLQVMGRRPLTVVLASSAGRDVTLLATVVSLGAVRLH